MNYLWIKTCTLFVQLLAEKKESASFLKQIECDIIKIMPAAILEAKHNQKTQNNNKILIQALLYLNPSDRFFIMENWLNKFPENHPTVIKIHKYFDLLEESMKNQASYTSTRIYKYTLRIDDAIMNNKYSLAIKLTNRCLKEYYYLYLKQKNKLYSYSFYKKDARLLYQHIIDYLNPYSSKEEQEELLSIAMFTNSLSTMVEDMQDGKSSPDEYTSSYLKKGMKEIMEYLKGK